MYIYFGRCLAGQWITIASENLHGERLLILNMWDIGPQKLIQMQLIWMRIMWLNTAENIKRTAQESYPNGKPILSHKNVKTVKYALC